MADQSIQRKLVAILYADVAGYSRLTGVDEVGTHQAADGLGDAHQSHRKPRRAG